MFADSILHMLGKLSKHFLIYIFSFVCLAVAVFIRFFFLSHNDGPLLYFIFGTFFVFRLHVHCSALLYSLMWLMYAYNTLVGEWCTYKLDQSPDDQKKTQTKKNLYHEWPENHSLPKDLFLVSNAGRMLLHGRVVPLKISVHTKMPNVKCKSQKRLSK